MSRLMTAAISLAAFLTASLASLPAQDDKQAADAAQPKSTLITIAAYPLDTCIVSGRSVAGDKAKTFEAGGRTFTTCCGNCQAKIEKDPETYVAKLDAAVIAQQEASYPLDKCPISGKALGSMGDPHKMVLAGHLVKLCCDHCSGKAKLKQDEIVKKIDAANYAKQKASYPVKVCVVTGDELGDETVDVMAGGRLVRFCCEDCIADFRKSPAKYMAKLAGGDDAKKSDAKADTDTKTDAKKTDAKQTDAPAGKATGAKAGGKQDGEQAAAGAGSCCDTEAKSTESCCDSGAKAGKACCEAKVKAGESAGGCCDAKPAGDAGKAEAKADVKTKPDAKPAARPAGDAKPKVN